MPLREYAGAASPTKLAGTLAIGTTTSFAVVTGGGTSFPTGATAPFVVVIDRNTATEEKILVASRASDTFSTLTRGYDGTSAQAHQAQAVVEHVVDAASMTEANAHVNTTARDDHTQYFNAARHAATPHTSAMIQDLAIATADIQDAAITYAKLEVGQRWEVGDIKASARATPSTGWALCDGSEILGTSFPALATELGTGATSRYGAAATGNIKLPDFRQKFPMGKAAAGTGSTLGSAGGSKDAIVPIHTHAVETHNHSGTSGNEKSSLSHGHGTSDGAGSHQHQTTSSSDLPPIVAVGGSTGLVGTSPALQATSDAGHTAKTSSNGGHNHTVDANGPGAHQHDMTVGNNSNSGSTTTQTAVTDANLPPWQTVNYFIKTT